MKDNIRHLHPQMLIYSQINKYDKRPTVAIITVEVPNDEEVAADLIARATVSLPVDFRSGDLLFGFELAE